MSGYADGYFTSDADPGWGGGETERSFLIYDVWLLFPVLFLVGLGLVMVYSASSALAMKKFGTDYYFLKRQAIYAGMGLFVLLGFRFFPLKYLYRLTYPLLGLAVLLLVLIHIPGLGVTAGGATRWLRMGGFSFQPSEFVRFVLIIYLAYSMSKKGDKLGMFSVGFMPHFLVFLILGYLIILQPDFGSAAILFIMTWVMLFVGGVPLKHLIAVLLALSPVAYLFLINSSYRMKRILSFWDPWQYASDEGYQAIHSLMAFGTGGIWGAGLGKGFQKLFYLPEPHTDFIFSVIGEELGLLGVLGVLSCYVIILWKGIVIARNTEDNFSAFLAIGLVSAIGLQVCVNLGVALSLLPPKGLTLPFLSYGGTSLLINMASIGVLMNIGALLHHDQTS